MEEENRGFFSYGYLPASKHCIYEQTSFPSLTKKVNEGKKTDENRSKRFHLFELQPFFQMQACSFACILGCILL